MVVLNFYFGGVISGVAKIVHKSFSLKLPGFPGQLQFS